MRQYVTHNVNKKSSSTIQYLLKMLAKIMETIIFVFMGVSTATDMLKWNTGFILITLAACTIYRIIGKRNFIFTQIHTELIYHLNLKAVLSLALLQINGV